MHQLSREIAEAIKTLYGLEFEPELTRPEPQFGDYATNVAMQLANEFSSQPQQIAKELAAKIKTFEGVEAAEVAGPGFINIRLNDQALVELMKSEPNQMLKDQQILVEFGDPNPFKEMHIGHLYSYTAGEAICRLLEAAGAKVERLSYHGDVGLHVAKEIYGFLELGEGASIGESYAYGAERYANHPNSQKRIEAINQAIYSGDDPSINQIYETGRQDSFAEFDKVLAQLSIKTDKRYLESQAAAVGQQMVEANIGKVFAKSDGAIVYKGEKDGLHTRVFITSQGLPTYEAKDLGLAKLKDNDYPKAAKSIIITAHEQAEYFKVMLAALHKIDPEIANKTTHMYHGFVNLSTGKMSSRTGDVYSATRLMADVQAEAEKAFAKSDETVELGAIKYAFLNHRLGSDITYDPAEAVSLEGDSGPYLQYAYARANSILKKATVNSKQSTVQKLEPAERLLVRKIGEFGEIVDRAVAELMPSHICTYLYELAQEFNRFYEKHRVIGDERQAIRLQLVEAYADKLKAGLKLLNITAPDKL